MSSNVTETFERVQPGSNAHIWSGAPQFRNRSGQNYQGRLFIELWDNDSQIVRIGSPSLETRALTALTGKHVRIAREEVPWDDAPVTGHRNQTFLGCVILELWEDRVFVALTGPSPERAFAKAVRVLTEYTDQTRYSRTS